MWQPIVKSAHFVAELALGVLVILGFMCWVWFIYGLLYYRTHKDLPDYHVQAEEHQGLKWWNAWRWSLSESYRSLQHNIIVESAIFGISSILALIWVLDLILI